VPNGAAILSRSLRRRSAEPDRESDHSLKASPVERTKHLGGLFGVGLPSELRLFVHREAYAFF
jgi:hypothetical protein